MVQTSQVQAMSYAYNVYYVKLHYCLLHVAQQALCPAGYQAAATRLDVGRFLLVVFVFFAGFHGVIQNTGGDHVS